MAMTTDFLNFWVGVKSDVKFVEMFCKIKFFIQFLIKSYAFLIYLIFLRVVFQADKFIRHMMIL